MSDENKQRIKVSLAGLVSAAIAAWGLVAWVEGRASVESVQEVKSDVEVLKSEISGIAEDVRYIRKRVDDRRD